MADLILSHFAEGQSQHRGISNTIFEMVRQPSSKSEKMPQTISDYTSEHLGSLRT